jgi:hypothetical protein
MDEFSLEWGELDVYEYEGETYIASMRTETSEDLTIYIIALFNHTTGKPKKFHTGLDDFQTYDQDEAIRRYEKCLSPETAGAA